MSNERSFWFRKVTKYDGTEPIRSIEYVRGSFISVYKSAVAVGKFEQRDISSRATAFRVGVVIGYKASHNLLKQPINTKFAYRAYIEVFFDSTSDKKHVQANFNLYMVLDKHSPVLISSAFTDSEQVGENT